MVHSAYNLGCISSEKIK